ncbi:MAG: hypothetical protein QOI80_507 [Solirubrobacteraceae bacterium]|nr:hypothetical protein [Solirubrobacteraceae bacterium]
MLTGERVLEPRGPAAAFLLSDAEVESLGGGKKVFPVAVTIGDHVTRGRLARMGDENLIGFSRAAREAAGLEIGGRYDVTIAVDDAPREVEVPEALAAALTPEQRARFDALSYTNRKELARSVAEAKRDETRERRIAKIVDAL